ncbi:hypothetical protein AX15_002336 [Amanita polypyramis BW_CC]|nr:hypothetical protein AX15_002336 [Amanita polypyramis BW_CC]
MQYLFMVRRDARSLPDVSRAANPYEVPNRSPSTLDNFAPSHPALPSPEWRAVYKTRFCNFRKNFNQPTIHVEYVSERGNKKVMPDKKERDLWWAFLSGKPEREWNPPRKPKVYKAKQGVQLDHAFADNEETTLLYEVPQIDPAVQESDTSGQASAEQPPSSPPMFERRKTREPLPSLLKRIDERMALHLLMYFAHWFNLYLDGPQGRIYQPTECHARWMFALLARVEDCITGDDIALLRSLARACLAVVKKSLQRHLQPESMDYQEDAMRERSCWIIISTIVDVWEQRDLWMDAEEMLRGVVS